MKAEHGPFRVLLVEDEDTDAYLVGWALGENKIRVDLHRVRDGREALEFLRRAGPYADAPRPGLILLDLNMPRMNGLECLAAVRRDPALCGIPVAMLSSSCDRDEISAALDLGANGFFTKPMAAEQFAETIRILAERWVLPALSAPHTTGSKP